MHLKKIAKVVTIMKSGAAAAFSPTDIAGLVGWWDFSDISTLYQDSGKTTAVSADGDPIGAAVDKSGTGNDITQGTTAAKPTYKTAIQNGLSVARYDGGDFLARTAALMTNSFTAIVFYQATAVGSVQWLIDQYDASAGGNRNSIFADTRASPKRHAFMPTFYVDNDVQLSTSTWYLSATKNDGSFLSGWRDGTVLTPVDSSSATGQADLDTISIGASNATGSFSGDIGEILIYNSSLSAANLNSIGAYYVTKWAATWSTIT